MELNISNLLIRYIWFIDTTLTDTKTPGQIWPWNNGNEKVQCTLRIFRCTELPSGAV